MITAVWMLLVGASIVSVIMIQNLRAAEIYGFERDQVQAKYLRESAVQTVIADMLFNGPRGEFARLPAKTTYTFDGAQVRVSVSSESGKIDINQADPALIERALAGLGIAARQRQAFVGEVKRYRSVGRLYISPGDAVAGMARAGISFDSDFCPDAFFTTWSGLAQPAQNQMDGRLARALGQPESLSNATVRPGTAVRIMVQTTESGPTTAVVRTSGLIGKPFTVVHWSDRAGCEEE